MKKFLIILCFHVSINVTYAQENAELKKIKCLSKMPTTYEEIEKQDTIYILYHKSDRKGFEQNKSDTEKSTNRSYSFFKYNYFPLEIYDNNGYEKINFRKPIEFNKKKSFICKNIKKTIDVYFLKKFGYEFYTDFFQKKRMVFIIDLDTKIKNKYNIVQVNNPRYIIE